MIRSFTLAGGRNSFLENLPVRGRKLEFTPGLNVIFAPNATGKSTALKMLAALTSLHNVRRGDTAEGLPAFGMDFWESVMGRGRRSYQEALEYLPNHVFDQIFRRRESRKGRIEQADLVRFELEWDRRPALLIEGRGAMESVSYFGQSAYGIAEEVENLFSDRAASSGQAVLGRLFRVMGQLQEREPPYYPKSIADREGDTVWAPRCKLWNTWVDQFKPKGHKRPTLLLDEPDLSLSPFAQRALWGKLAELAEERKIQLICTSHSPFCLTGPNVVELVDGYAKETQAAFVKLGEDLTKMTKEGLQNPE